MDIQTKAKELLRLNSVDAMLQVARTSDSITASDASVKVSIEHFGESLKHKKHKKAVATMLALLLWDADNAVARIRRKGLLRASRYDFRVVGVQKVIETALGLVPKLKMRTDRIAYLRSVSDLLKVSHEALRLRESLVKRLKARRRVVQKTLLYIVNEAFSQGWRGDRDAHTDNIEHWSAEDLSSAVSYIVHLMRKEVGTEKNLWQNVDEESGEPFDNFYTNLLIDAARLNELSEVESLIDGMPYEVVAEGNVLRVFSTDEMLEKSIRLGYIQSSIQSEIRNHDVIHHFQRQEHEPPTMKKFIAEAFKAGMDELVQLRQQPIERLVVGLIQDKKFFEPIASDNYFAEDIACLISVGIENFFPDDSLFVRVSENLSAIDIIKFQRFFRFLDAVFEEKLSSFQDSKRQNTLRKRSTLPIIRAEELRNQIEFILSPAKTAEVIKLLTLSENERFIDLQYKPLIAAGQNFIIAPGLIAHSNLVRNIVTANNLRKLVLGDEDPMEDMVLQALREAGFKVRGNFEFNIDGKRETDIVCWRDGHLFVFECKNSFHPCSPHETRTSYEHLRKAEKQLDVRVQWLKVKENQERLLRWLDWEIPVTENVHTGIITANRVFNGYMMGQHPVRQAHELINVVKNGHIRIAEDETVSFWRGVHLNARDLVGYLEGDSVIQLQFAQMHPFERRIQIGEFVLSLQNYVMDMEASIEATREAFKEREPS